jgi:hypothetical protein
VLARSYRVNTLYFVLEDFVLHYFLKMRSSVLIIVQYYKIKEKTYQIAEDSFQTAGLGCSKEIFSLTWR